MPGRHDSIDSVGSIDRIAEPYRIGVLISSACYDNDGRTHLALGKGTLIHAPLKLLDGLFGGRSWRDHTATMSGFEFSTDRRQHFPATSSSSSHIALRSLVYIDIQINIDRH